MTCNYIYMSTNTHTHTHTHTHDAHIYWLMLGNDPKQGELKKI